MLKNKFGMLKVVALALTVLMLATLVACNKGMDDAAIQDAINNAVQSQSDAVAAEQSKLAASMSEAQAKADAEAKAAQESLAAAQAEAQKKIEEAEKLAAEASKAAAEAEKKAAEEASKAAESAAKAAEQAKKDAEEASKALESMQSSIAQSSKDAVTATTAPSAELDAIKAIQHEVAKLQIKYLSEMRDLYLADQYVDLTLTIDKASTELQYVTTEAAAQSILDTLIVDLAAIENVQNRADAVQALVADLGDIETEVFTTQVEKIIAAEEALEDLKKDYAKNSKLNSVLKATVDTEDLTKARKKLDTLSDYIEASLAKDIQTLVIADRKGTYDPEDMMTKPISITGNAVVGTVNTNFGAVIDNAYYSYRVLAYINGGDLAAADAPIDWEDLVKNDKVVEAGATAKHPITGKGIDNELDLDKPTAYYSVEDLLNNYILPTLDYRFELYKETLVQDLEDRLYGNESEKITGAIDTLYNYGAELINGEFNAIIDKDDIDDIFEVAVDEFAAELAEITFTGSYKTEKVYNDALKDLNKKFATAYVAAVMEIIEVSKDNAIEIYTEEVYDAAVDAAEEEYTEDEEAAKLEAAVATQTVKLDKFTANVEAAAIYDYAGIIAESVRKANKIDGAVVEESNFYSGITVTETFYAYVNAVAEKSIKNFKVDVQKVQEGILGEVTTVMIADLKAFLDAWTVPDEDGKEKEPYDTLAGREESDASTPWNPTEKEYVWTRAEQVAALNAKIAAAIEAIEALDTIYYTDKEVNIKWADNEDAGKALKNKNLFFKEAAAKEHFEKTYGALPKSESKITKDIAKSYFTATDTGLPLTYTFTAEAQAIEAAEKLYEQAWKDIYSDVVTMMGYKAAYEKKLNNNDGDLKDSGFEAALSEATGSDALVAELNAFGAIYTGKIAAALDAGKYANALGSASLYDFFKQDNLVGATHITCAYPVDNTETEENEVENAYAFTNFALKNITDKLDAEIKPCNDNAKNLVKLYSYKFAAVEKVAVAVNAAKYTYTTVDGATVASEVTYDYSNASAAAAQKYEEAITAFIAKAEAEIMAVTMADKKPGKVSDWAGNQILADANILTYEKATAYIDALVTKYVGTDGSWKKIDGVPYNYANSMIFQQYKMLIKNNYSGWTNLANYTPDAQ